MRLTGWAEYDARLGHLRSGVKGGTKHSSFFVHTVVLIGSIASRSSEMRTVRASVSLSHSKFLGLWPIRVLTTLRMQAEDFASLLPVLRLWAMDYGLWTLAYW